jgi:hypothetical protein
LAIDCNHSGYCKDKCAKLKDKERFIKKNSLPVWIKDGVVMYSLPSCLKNLSHAEKMLIQRISPFVPLYHIKNGTFGITGHVCCFEQDIEGFVNKLPRTKDDSSMLKVLQKVKAETCGDEDAAQVKAFRVRKRNVLEALKFLQKYNREYHDVSIDPSALDWIAGEEGVLDGNTIDTDSLETALDANPMTEDMGPVPKQALHPRQRGDDITSFGYLDTGSKTAALSARDRSINVELQNAVKTSPNKKDIVVDWPAVSASPVSEYGGMRIFVNAFPWLFPGGIGDVRDYVLGTNGVNIAEWGKHMIYYEDGRFAKDQIFGFFAMNYIVRQRNATAGNWFIDKFQKNCPDTLEELKELTARGETSFINSLVYYNQRVKGSSSYWFKKRCELYSWINHHIEVGNGAPMFFITLSCAEYLWPDIIRLIKQRMDLAGEDSSLCYVGSPKLGQYVNQYSIVVQEFFQRRVVLWLDTVGKHVFGIRHYWVRYEFAPGRGQIHAHLLAIPGDQSIYELCYAALRLRDGEAIRAKYLAEWAEKKLGLTASVSDNFDECEVDESNSPIQIRFTDVSATSHDDFEDLMRHVQVHNCSAFCMKEDREFKRYIIQLLTCLFSYY